MKKKPVSFIILMLLLACFLFTFTACNDEEVAPVERISLTSLPQLEYLKGQPFVLNDAQITVYYSDGDTEVIPLTLEMISDYDVQSVGKHTLEIKYENVATSVAIVIRNSAITKVEVVDGEVPYKKEYIVDQLFDASNIFLKVSYESGNPDVIPVTSNMISSVNMNKVGKKTLTVTYLRDYEATFDIEIVEKSVAAISVVEVPDKRLYLLNETIDDFGGVLHISYDNGYAENKRFSALFATEEEKRGAYVYDFSYVQNRSVVTLKYGGKSVIFDVKVMKKAATAFKLVQPPEGVQIVGTDLRLGGGILEITYNNETTETVPMTDERVTANGYRRNDVGSQNITLAFSDVPETFEFSINVIAATPIGLEVLSPVDFEGNPVIFYQDSTVDLTKWEYRLLLDNGNYTAKMTLSSDMYVPDESGKDLLTLDTYGMRTLNFRYQVGVDNVLTCSYNLSVTRKVIAALDVVKPTLAIYYRGGELNLQGSSFTALFNDGSRVSSAITSDMISAFNSSLVGYQDVTVTYKNPLDESDFKRNTFKVLIVRRATAIEVQSIGKSTYILGENFTITGLTVAVYYEGSIVPEILEAPFGDAWVFSDTSTDVIGNKNVKVEYVADGGKVETVIPITVTNDLLGIELVNGDGSPLNTVEYEGRDYPDLTKTVAGTELNLNGAKLKLTMQNGVAEDPSQFVVVTQAMTDYVRSDKTPGKREITVSYSLRGKTQSVVAVADVVPRAVSNVAITALPDRLYYKAGAEFAVDLTALTLRLDFTNGSFINLTEDMRTNATSSTLTYVYQNEENKSVTVLISIDSLTSELRGDAVNGYEIFVTYNGDPATETELTLNDNTEGETPIVLAVTRYTVEGSEPIVPSLPINTSFNVVFTKEIVTELSWIITDGTVRMIADAPLYENKDDNGNQKLSLEIGSIVTVVSEDGGWYEVSYKGESGYVLKSDTETLAGVTVQPEIEVREGYADFEFDIIDDLYVKITLDEGEEIVVRKISELRSGLTVENYNPYKPGAQIVYFRYKGKRLDAAINVRAKALLSIAAADDFYIPPTIQGLDLDLKRAKLNITYYDPITGDSLPVTVIAVSRNMTNYDKTDLEVNDREVKITYIYNGVSKMISYSVPVLKKSLLSIGMGTIPKNKYIEGDNFTTENGTIILYYDNKTTKTLALDLRGEALSGLTVDSENRFNTGEFSGFAKLQTMIVRYTEEGEVYETSYDIIVKDRMYMNVVWSNDDYFDQETATSTYWYGVVAVPSYVVYGYTEFSDIPKNPVPMNDSKTFELTYIEINPVSRERTDTVYTSWPKNAGTYLVSLKYNADSSNDRVHNSFLNEERYIVIMPKRLTLQIQDFSRVYGKTPLPTDITVKVIDSLTGSELNAEDYPYGDAYEKAKGTLGKLLLHNFLPGSENVFGIPLLWKYLYAENFEEGDVYTEEEIRSFADLSELNYLASVGKYVVCALADGTVRNYSLTFIYGDYTINPRPVRVIPDSGQKKEYGEVDSLLTFGVEGIAGNPDSGMVDAQTLSGVMMRAVGDNVGTYLINYGTLPSSNPNYAMGLTEGDGGAFVKTVTFEIYKRKLYLKVNDYTIIYGQMPPSFSNASVTASSDYPGKDFVTGDSMSSLTYSAGSNLLFTCYDNLQAQTSVGNTSDVGVYEINIVPTSVSSRNYTITFYPGSLTVSKRPVRVAANAKTKVFGDADPILDYVASPITGNELSGLCNGDVLAINLLRETGEDVETKETLPKYVVGRPLSTQGLVKRYEINYGNNIVTANPNYDITYVPNYLTITKKSISVNVDVLKKYYDGKLPSVDESGFSFYDEEGNKLCFYDAEGNEIDKLYKLNGSDALLYDGTGSNISAVYNFYGQVDGVYTAGGDPVQFLYNKDGVALTEVYAQSIRKTVESKVNVTISFESTAKNIGTYNVIIEHNDVNHIITNYYEFGYSYVIEKKPIQPVFIGIPGTEGVSNLYKGSNYEFDAVVNSEDICTGDTVTVSVNIKTAKNVETEPYVVTMTGLSNTNYAFRELADGETDYKTVSFQILPAVVDVMVTTREKTYSGRTVTFDNNVTETFANSGLYRTDDYEIQTPLTFRPSAISVYPYYGEDLPPYQVAYEMDADNNYIFRKDGQTLVCGSSAMTFGVWASSNGWTLQNARTGEYVNNRYSFSLNCIDYSIPFVGWAKDSGWEYTIVGYQIKAVSTDKNYRARLVNSVGDVITNSEGLIPDENAEYKFMIKPLEVPITLNPNYLTKEYDGKAPNIGTSFGVGSVLNKSMIFFAYERISTADSPYVSLFAGDTTITEEDYVVPDFMKDYITNADRGVFYVKPMTTNMNCIVKINDASKKYYKIRTRMISNVIISSASKQYDSLAPSLNAKSDVIFSNMETSSKEYLKLKLILNTSPDPVKGYVAGYYDYVLRGEFPYENPVLKDEYKDFIDYNHKLESRLLDENGVYSGVYVISQRYVRVELLENEREGYNWKYYDGTDAYPEFFETNYTAYDTASANTSNQQFYLYGNGSGVEGVDFEFLSTVLKERGGKLRYTKYTTPSDNGTTIDYGGVANCDTQNFYVTYVSKKVYIKKKPVKVYMTEMTREYGTDFDQSDYSFTMSDAERASLSGYYDVSGSKYYYKDLPDSDLFGTGLNRLGVSYVFNTSGLIYGGYDSEGRVLDANSDVDTDGSLGYYAHSEGNKLPSSYLFDLSLDMSKSVGGYKITRKELKVSYADADKKTVTRYYGDDIYNVNFAYTGFTAHDADLATSDDFKKPPFTIKGSGLAKFQGVAVLNDAIELSFAEGDNTNYYFTYDLTSDVRLEILMAKMEVSIISNDAYNAFDSSYVWDGATALSGVADYVYVYNNLGDVKAIPASVYNQTVSNDVEFSYEDAYTEVGGEVWNEPILPENYTLLYNSKGEAKAVLTTVYNAVISSVPYVLDADTVYGFFSEYQYLYNKADTLKLVPVSDYAAAVANAGAYKKVVTDVYGTFTGVDRVYTFDDILDEEGNPIIMITDNSGYKLMPVTDFIAGVTNQSFDAGALYNLFDDYADWNYSLVFNERTGATRRVNIDEYNSVDIDDYTFTADEAYASFTADNDWSGISQLKYGGYHVVISDEISGELKFRALMGELFYPVTAGGLISGMDAYNMYGAEYNWDYRLVYSPSQELKIVPLSVYNATTAVSVNSLTVYNSFGTDKLISDMTSVSFASPYSVVIGGGSGFKLLSGSEFYASAAAGYSITAESFYNQFRVSELAVGSNISGYDAGSVYINNQDNTRCRRINASEFYSVLSSYLFYGKFSSDYIERDRIWDAGNVILGNGNGSYKVIPEADFYSLLAKETYFRAFETAVNWTENYVFITNGLGDFKAVPQDEFYDATYAEIEYNLFAQSYLFTGNKDYVFIYDADGNEKPIKKEAYYSLLKDKVLSNILLKSGDLGYNASYSASVVAAFDVDADTLYEAFDYPEYDVEVWRLMPKTKDYVLLYNAYGTALKAVPESNFYESLISEYLYLTVSDDYVWDYVFIYNESGEAKAVLTENFFPDTYNAVAKFITGRTYDAATLNIDPKALYEAFSNGYIWSYVTLTSGGSTVKVPNFVYLSEISGLSGLSDSEIFAHFNAVDYDAPAFMKKFVFLYGENGEMKAVPREVFYGTVKREIVYSIFPAYTVYTEDLSVMMYSPFFNAGTSPDYVYIFRKVGEETEYKRVKTDLFYSALNVFGGTSGITAEYFEGNIAALGAAGPQSITAPTFANVSFTANEYHFLIPFSDGKFRLISGEVFLNSGVKRRVRDVATVYGNFDNALNKSYRYITDDGVGKEYVFIYRDDKSEVKAVPYEDYLSIINSPGYVTDITAEYGFPPTDLAYVYIGIKNPSADNNPEVLGMTNQIRTDLQLDVTEETQAHRLTPYSVITEIVIENYQYDIKSTIYNVNRRSLDVYLELISTSDVKGDAVFNLIYGETPYLSIPDGALEKDYTRLQYKFIIGVADDGSSQFAYDDEAGNGPTYDIDTSGLILAFDPAAGEGKVITAMGLIGGNYRFNYIPSVLNVYRRVTAIGVEATPKVASYELSTPSHVYGTLTGGEITDASVIYNHNSVKNVYPEVNFSGNDVSKLAFAESYIYIFNADHTKYRAIPGLEFSGIVQNIYFEMHAFSAEQKDGATPTEIPIPATPPAFTDPYTVLRVGSDGKFFYGAGSVFANSLVSGTPSAETLYAHFLSNGTAVSYSGAISSFSVGYYYFFNSNNTIYVKVDINIALAQIMTLKYGFSMNTIRAAMPTEADAIADPKNASLVGYDILEASPINGESGMYLPYVAVKKGETSTPDLMVKVSYNDGSVDYFNLNDRNVTVSGTLTTYANMSNYLMGFTILEPVPNNTLFDVDQEMRISFEETLFGTHTFSCTSIPFLIRYYDDKDTVYDSVESDLGVTFGSEIDANTTKITSASYNFDKLDVTFRLLPKSGQTNYYFNIIADSVAGTNQKLVLSFKNANESGYNTVYFEAYDGLGGLISNRALLIPSSEVDFFDGLKHNVVIYKDRLGSNLAIDDRGFNVIIIVDSKYYYNFDFGYDKYSMQVKYSLTDTSALGFEVNNVRAWICNVTASRLGFVSSKAIKVIPDGSGRFVYSISTVNASAQINWTSLIKYSVLARSSYENIIKAGKVSYRIFVDGSELSSMNTSLGIGKHEVSVQLLYSGEYMDTCSFVVVVTTPYENTSIGGGVPTPNKPISIVDGSHNVSMMQNYAYYRLSYDLTFNGEGTSYIYLKTNAPAENIVTTENTGYLGAAISIERTAEGTSLTKLHFRDGITYFYMDLDNPIGVNDYPVYGRFPIDWNSGRTLLEVLFDTVNNLIIVSLTRENEVIYYNRFGSGMNSSISLLDMTTLTRFISSPGSFSAPIVADNVSMTIYQMQRGLQPVYNTDFITNNEVTDISGFTSVSGEFVASTGNLSVDRGVKLIASNGAGGFYTQNYTSVKTVVKGKSTDVIDSENVGHESVMFRIWLFSNRPILKIGGVTGDRGVFLEYVRRCTALSGTDVQYEFILQLVQYKKARRYVEQVIYTTPKVWSQYGESTSGDPNLLDENFHTIIAALREEPVEDNWILDVTVDGTVYHEAFGDNLIIPVSDYQMLSYYNTSGNVVSGNDPEGGDFNRDAFTLGTYKYYGFEAVEGNAVLNMMDVN